jgi:hypothetical protein
MGAESPVRPGRLSPQDPGVTGLVGEIWSGRRCTQMFGDHLPVGPHRPGLALVFGSRSRVVSSTGVQAFSEAHGGCGTIRTVTDAHEPTLRACCVICLSTSRESHNWTECQSTSLWNGKPAFVERIPGTGQSRTMLRVRTGKLAKKPVCFKFNMAHMLEGLVVT